METVEYHKDQHENWNEGSYQHHSITLFKSHFKIIWCQCDLDEPHLKGEIVEWDPYHGSCDDNQCEKFEQRAA